MFNLTPMQTGGVAVGVIVVIVVVVLLIIFLPHHGSSSAGNKKPTKESIQHDIATVQASIASITDTSNISTSKSCLKTASSATNQKTLDSINTSITKIANSIKHATLSESDMTNLTKSVKALQDKSALLHKLRPCGDYCTGGATYDPDKNECDADVSYYNKTIAALSEDLDKLIASYVIDKPAGAGDQPSSGGQTDSGGKSGSGGDTPDPKDNNPPSKPKPPTTESWVPANNKCTDIDNSKDLQLKSTAWCKGSSSETKNTYCQSTSSKTCKGGENVGKPCCV